MVTKWYHSGTVLVPKWYQFGAWGAPPDGVIGRDESRPYLWRRRPSSQLCQLLLCIFSHWMARRRELQELAQTIGHCIVSSEMELAERKIVVRVRFLRIDRDRAMIIHARLFIILVFKISCRKIVIHRV